MCRSFALNAFMDINKELQSDKQKLDAFFSVNVNMRGMSFVDNSVSILPPFLKPDIAYGFLKASQVEGFPLEYFLYPLRVRQAGQNMIDDDDDQNSEISPPPSDGLCPNLEEKVVTKSDVKKSARKDGKVFIYLGSDQHDKDAKTVKEPETKENPQQNQKRIYKKICEAESYGAIKKQKPKRMISRKPAESIPVDYDVDFQNSFI